MRSDPMINTALLIGGVRHPCPGHAMFNLGGCALGSKDGPATPCRCLAPSLARPALEQQTKSPLESRRERPEERASIAFRARGVQL